jgi:hypothetical protein
MWKKIKDWWNRLRGKEEVDNTTLLFHNTQPISTVWQEAEYNALTFTSGNGEDIFCIDGNGNAKWLKEDCYDEAAEIFLNSMNWRIESAAGIQESRMEWEKKITDALVDAAEERGGSITTEELTDVVRKCIMYDKLKGKYSDE